MSEPILLIVALSDQHARDLCAAQKIKRSKGVVVLATNSTIQPSKGRKLNFNDAVVTYGSWTSGRNSSDVRAVLASLLNADDQPFMYHAYMSDEAIPWPATITERFMQ